MLGKRSVAGEEGWARPPTWKWAARPLTYIQCGLGSNTSHQAALPRGDPRPTPAGWCGPGRGPARGLPCPHSLVRKGRYVLQKLPRDTLQNDVPEGGVAQHVAPVAVDRKHLEAILRAGTLHTVHLQAQSNTAVMCGPETLLPHGSHADPGAACLQSSSTQSAPLHGFSGGA